MSSGLVPAWHARFSGGYERASADLAATCAHWAGELEGQGIPTTTMCTFVNMANPDDVHATMVPRDVARRIARQRLSTCAAVVVAQAWNELLTDLDKADPPWSMRLFLFDEEGGHSELLEGPAAWPVTTAPGGDA